MPAFWPSSVGLLIYDGDAGTTSQGCNQNRLPDCRTPCVVALNASGGHNSAAYLAYQYSVYNLCTTSSFTISLLYDAFNICTNRFRVNADGVQIFTSGCITGSGSATVTIPAGTKTIDILVDGVCSAPTPCSDQWSLVVSCP